MRLARAAVSLAALALLLVGVPWVLAKAGTLPGGMPSGSDFSETLTSPDDGHVLFTVLTLVAWTLWGWFALGVLAELPRLLHRRPIRRQRRTLGAPQRLAGFLLGGLLVLPAGTAMAAPVPAQAATAPLQPSAPSRDITPATQTDARHSTPAARTATGRGPVHAVGETGETVWDLAVEYLGSGTRAQDIRALNPHLPDTTLLPAGTTVQLPADARASRAGTSPAPEPHVQLAASDEPISAAEGGERGKKHTHAVKPGESLSGIAEDETGDAAHWRQLYAATKNHDQPAGLPRLRDPDLIYPGQQITIPAASTPKAPHDGQEDKHDSSGDKKDDQHKNNDTDQNKGQEKDGRKEGGDPADSAGKPTEPAKPTPAPTPDQTTDKPSAPPSDRDRDTSPASPNSSASPAPSTPAPAPSSVTEKPSSVLNTRTAGVLVSLAAAVTLALTVRRILQRRRARPGELIAIPEEVSPAEAQMAQTAEPAGPLRLDQALRTLACQAGRDGHQLPAVRGARITGNSVQILPEDLQATPAPPFTSIESGWWVCDEGVELLEEQDAAQVDAPYPGLATIGADASGHLVLLNLPHAGVILLKGQQEQVEEILTSMALELGMSPWSTEAEVVVTGFGEGLNHLLPTSRIAYMRESAHTARDFAESLLEAHQEPTGNRPPYLILCAPQLTADSAWQIAETFDKAADVMQVALIAPTSPSIDLLFEQSEVIDASSSQPQRIDILGTEITLQRLQRQAVDEITAALAVSGQDAHPAKGPWQHVPCETQTAHATRTTTATRQPDQTPDASRITDSASPTSPPVAADAANEGGHDSPMDAANLGVFPALLAASSSPAAINLPTPSDTPDRPNAPAAHAKEEEEEKETVPAEASTPLPWLQMAPNRSIAPHTPPQHAGPRDPVIQILGPVALSGVAASRHGTREAQLAALLHLKPGRSAATLCADMDPAKPWSTDTLNARLGGLRRSLGNDENGDPYVPRRAIKSDPYALSDKVCCDWHHFQRTAEAALPHGPAGLGQLEKALDQVHGRPFGAQPLPWSEPLQQEMTLRIVHVAHTVATYRLTAGPHHDLTLARRAIATGLEVDQIAELLYRTWFKIEAAAGNRGGLNAAISRLETVNRSLDLSPEMETEQLIRQLLDQTVGGH
ncbi:LysM peptidoglycan-binding domain-containing protein [Streptomyces sp. NPDC048436]|uniref:LysM peptidoglycan-binding domain-containing protein n=1 Tax=Streptomyces sp. NPDC048436 TaxID=3365550 RepID=UPI0037201626